ncbi:MAG: phosphatase PAP2 family protein [Sphingomicrobium sp.]
MSNREWAVPAVVLTLGAAVFALGVSPDYSGVLPALRLLPLWIAAAAGMAGVYAFALICRMMINGIERPTAVIAANLVRDWRRLVPLALFLILAGFNMITFMWAKPLLNHLIPFWADPLLADVDQALFLGRDPWRLLAWLNSDATAILYHRGWFGLMILTLLVVLMQPPSSRKSAALLSYFVLWSVIGPLIHWLLPAAGPVFYERLGYGVRFAEMPVPAETAKVAGFLWTAFANGGFGPGAGISAMPSLHIATTAWMTITVYLFAPRWAIPMATVGVLIFLLSISLGWHYAIDGIAGIVCALVTYQASAAFYRGRRRRPASETGALGPLPS